MTFLREVKNDIFLIYNKIYATDDFQNNKH